MAHLTNKKSEVSEHQFSFTSYECSAQQNNTGFFCSLLSAHGYQRWLSALYSYSGCAPILNYASVIKDTYCVSVYNFKIVVYLPSVT